MRLLSIIIFVLLIVGCQNRESDNDKLFELAAKTINDSINDKNAFYVDTIRILDTITENKYIDFLPIKRLNLFSDKDFDFMHSQNKIYAKNDLNELTKFGYKLIKINRLKTILDYKHFKGFYVISKPLYSLDYHKALLNVDFVCYDVGRGYILIMDKVNGKWELKRVLHTWIN